MGGTCSGWIGKGFDARFGWLSTVRCFAAGQLRCKGGVRRKRPGSGVDAYPIGPLTRIIGIPDVRPSLFRRTCSGWIMHVTETISRFLSGICFIAACHFRSVAGRVTCGGEDTLAATPRCRIGIVRMIGSRNVAGGSLEVANVVGLVLLVDGGQGVVKEARSSRCRCYRYRAFAFAVVGSIHEGRGGGDEEEEGNGEVEVGNHLHCVGIAPERSEFFPSFLNIVYFITSQVHI